MERNHLINSLDLSHKLWQAALKVNHPRRSLLGVSVFLLLAVNCIKSDKVSIKTLNADTGGPISVLRRLIRDLEAAGWVDSHVDVDDLRVRVIHPTAEFQSIVEELAHDCHHCISSHPLVSHQQAKRRV
jgi:DNA-binding MarR family transcriptional regulator